MRNASSIIAALSIASLVSAGKVLAFGKDVSMSMYFGAGTASDAYFISNAVPGLLWAAFHATINTVFLPYYVREKIANRGAKAGSEAILLYSIVGVGMGVLCVFLARYFVRAIAPAADAELTNLASNLTAIMAIGFYFSGYVAVQNALQQANGQIYAPLSVPVINNVIGIVAILLAARYDNITYAVIGAVAAWAVQAPLHRITTRRFYPFTLWVHIPRSTLVTLGALSFPVMLGIFLDQFNLLVGVYFAGAFGEGAISHLSYANRLALFVAGLFSFVIAYLIFPRLAEGAAKGTDTVQSLYQGLLLIVITTIPLSSICFIARNDVANMIFGGGAFNLSDTRATAGVFAFYAIGIIFMSLRDLFNRYFFSHGKNYPPLLIGLAATVFTAGTSAFLAKEIGVEGIALAASLGAIFYTALQVIVLHQWRKTFPPEWLVKPLLSLFISTLIAWTISSWMYELIDPDNSFSGFVIVTASFGLTYILAFGLTLRLLGDNVFILATTLLHNLSPASTLDAPRV